MTAPYTKILVTFAHKKLRLVHGFEATENQALKISVAWEIKRLVKQFDDIFNEFQFVHPHQTCLSAIILKEITTDSFLLTKTPGIIIYNDATGALDRVICGIALLALRSIGFATSVTRMIGLTWSKRKCYTKTGFGVSNAFINQPTISRPSGSDKDPLLLLTFGALYMVFSCIL
jgi:hypothetical protein